MKRLGRKILYFLLPTLFVWMGLEIFYRSVETNYTVKHNSVQQRYDDIEVLILGSSHSYFGINPAYFKLPAYNLSNISQSLYFDELLLEKHIDSLSSLKAVVMTVGYFSLSQEDNGLEDRWRKYFYDQQMDLDVPSVSVFDPKRYSLTLSRRLKRSADLVHEYLQNGTIITHNKNGFGIQDSTDIVADKEAVSMNIARKHEDGSTDFSTNESRLKRIIELCASKNVQLFIVQMPTYPTYYEVLNPKKWRKIDSTLSSLADSSPRVHHIKLSRHPDFKAEDLRDADHLTNEGAAKCSKMLDSIVRSEIAPN